LLRSTIKLDDVTSLVILNRPQDGSEKVAIMSGVKS